MEISMVLRVDYEDSLFVIAHTMCINTRCEYQIIDRVCLSYRIRCGVVYFQKLIITDNNAVSNEPLYLFKHTDVDN